MKGNRVFISGLLFKSHQDLESLTQETNVIKINTGQRGELPKGAGLGSYFGAQQLEKKKHSSQRRHLGM